MVKRLQGKDYRVLRVDYLGQRDFLYPLCQLSHAPRYTAMQCTALQRHAT
jgi:hypothetical protein